MPLNNHIKEWIAIFETAVIIFKLIWHDNLRGKRIKHTNISFLTIHSNDGMAQNCDLDCAGNTFFSFLSRIYSALGALNETLLQIGFSHQLMTRKRGWSKEQNFRRRDKFNRHGNFHYFFGTIRNNASLRVIDDLHDVDDVQNFKDYEETTTYWSSRIQMILLINNLRLEQWYHTFPLGFTIYRIAKIHVFNCPKYHPMTHTAKKEALIFSLGRGKVT